MAITDTFVRAVAAGYYRFVWGGDAHLRMNGTINGLLRDTICEAGRVIGRWTMPLDDTPVDALQWLLYKYGLPAYEELTDVAAYFATLDRVRDAWDTHGNAGATVMLEAQALLAGLTDAVIVVLAADTRQFWIETSDATPGGTYGPGRVYGEGRVYGAQIDRRLARNVKRAMRYFCPAGHQFAGYIVPT